MSDVADERWPVALATSSYIAREAAYDVPGGWKVEDPIDPYLGGWDRCEKIVTASFRPLERFIPQFDALLADVKGAGFRFVEIWGTHLNPAWATPDHVAAAREALERHGLTVVSYGADLGTSPQDVVTVCEIGHAIGSPLLGTYPGPFFFDNRDLVVGIIRDQGFRLLIENHPHHATPAAILEEVGDDRSVGVTLDTGWWGSVGYDAAAAIREIGDRIYHVHLKDVRAVGTHEPCLLGEGCIPIAACLDALTEIGYHGAVSLEHLTPTFDPTDDLRRMRLELGEDDRFEL